MRAFEGITFVVLAPNHGAAVRRILENGLPASAHRVTICEPAVHGLDFLAADGPVGAGLDAWWQRNVPPLSLPVYVIVDEPGLEEWIPGTDGYWFVGVEGPERGEALEATADLVFPVLSADPLVVAQHAMQAIANQDRGAPGVDDRYHYGLPPARQADVIPRPDPNAVGEGQSASYIADPPRPPIQPISYEAEPGIPRRSRSAPAITAAPYPPNSSGFGRLVAGARARAERARIFVQPGSRAAIHAINLGPTVNANRPIVAGFASRKGGVGKTTHAAAAAATIGEAFDGLPDTAALVDGNITNPDSWAFSPPPGAATVRELVSTLTRGLVPPAEVYAYTPRLAIYPESRHSEEPYTQSEVDVVAEHLRRRHSFVAIDLPNALPSLVTGGAGAVSAAWLAHCDVVVLPFNADPRARQGLFEYVEAVADDDALSGLPIVAPYIVSSNRAISNDPAVVADIAALTRMGVEVIEVPDDEQVLVALLKDRPINLASPGLRSAYITLTEAIVKAALRSRNRD